jgi:hypothetical protein
MSARMRKRPLAFHLRHAGYERDDRVLDPERPESPHLTFGPRVTLK